MFRTTGFDFLSSTKRVYDISPDDRRFVFTRLLSGPQTAAGIGPNLVRVDNWFTELAALRRPR